MMQAWLLVSPFRNTDRVQAFLNEIPIVITIIIFLISGVTV